MARLDESPYRLGGYDGRGGGGYGSVGRSRFAGAPVHLGAIYPYGSRERDECSACDRSPDRCECGPGCDCEECRRDFGDGRLANVTLSNVVAADPARARLGAPDRSALVTGASRLTLERIFTPDARSGPLSPRVSGSKHGWSRPQPGMPWDDDDESMPLSLRDVAVTSRRKWRRRPKRTVTAFPSAEKRLASLCDT